jgi:hypothetical protein
MGPRQWLVLDETTGRVGLDFVALTTVRFKEKGCSTSTFICLYLSHPKYGEQRGIAREYHEDRVS